MAAAAATCKVCGAATVKQCGGCKAVSYCCVEHQREDWSNHKEACAPPLVVARSRPEDPAPDRSGVVTLSDNVYFGVDLLRGRYVEAVQAMPAGTVLLVEKPIVMFTHHAEIVTGDDGEETYQKVSKLDADVLHLTERDVQPVTMTARWLRRYATGDEKESWLGRGAAALAWAADEELFTQRVRENVFGVTCEQTMTDFASAAYRLASWVNHSCAPNARTWIDSDYNLQMTVTHDVEAGEEIVHDYMGTEHMRCRCQRQAIFSTWVDEEEDILNSCRCARCETEAGTHALCSTAAIVRMMRAVRPMLPVKHITAVGTVETARIVFDAVAACVTDDNIRTLEASDAGTIFACMRNSFLPAARVIGMAGSSADWKKAYVACFNLHKLSMRFRELNYDFLPPVSLPRVAKAMIMYYTTVRLTQQAREEGRAPPSTFTEDGTRAELSRCILMLMGERGPRAAYYDPYATGRPLKTFNVITHVLAPEMAVVTESVRAAAAAAEARERHHTAGVLGDLPE